MPRPEGNVSAPVECFFQFALLGLVASGFLAVAGSGYLDAPTVWLTSAGLLLRGLMLAGVVRFRISERASTAVTCSYALFLIADYFLISREIVAVTVHLVFFLAVIKILTARSNRDHLSVAGIAMLELLAAALVSLDYRFMLSISLYLLFAVAALMSAEVRRSMARPATTSRAGLKRFSPRLGMLTCAILVGILGFTALLFFVLPRTADAALSRFAHRDLLPGFANEVTLETIGRIKTTSQPVMHIRLFGDGPPGAFKWRGASLSDFDGRRWTNPFARKLPVPLRDGRAELSNHPFFHGPRLNYMVQFEALDADALFFTGIPERIELKYPHLLGSEDGDYSLGQDPPRGFSYEAYGILDSPPERREPEYPPPVLGLEGRSRYLQLPSRLDPRIPQLAVRMAGEAGSDLQRARSMENHFHTEFRYTLELADKNLADPLSYFLFNRREGHCEYFASAMAVMLRSLGIPARLVTGFQGGTYNAITELWVVRASDAHSWVEAWMPGYGWTTFDPTPPDTGAHAFAPLAALNLYLDAAQTFWQEWVVGYDMGRQGALAGRMESGARRVGIRWYDAIAALRSAWERYSGATTRNGLIGVATTLLVSFLGWRLAPILVRAVRARRRERRVRRGQATVGDATLLYERMLRAMKRRGHQKPAWFTPREFAASLPAGPTAATVSNFTSAYNELRFGGRTESAAQLSVLLDELERRP
jgi:protein-glutamine gamma-glutamyltransferase